MTQPPRNTSSRAGVYAAVALAAAMLIGGAAGFALARRQVVRAPRMTEMTVLGVSRSTLLDSLELTTEQRRRIDALLDDAERRATASIDRMMTDVREATEGARRELRALLDERQRARFDSILSVAPPLRPRTPLPGPSRSP